MTYDYRSTARTLAVLASLAAANFAAPTIAQAETALEFVDKKYAVEGAWTVVKEGDQTLIRFADSFSTKGGPDLKVFLSPTSIQDASGKNATKGSVLLGVLQSTSGSQDYVLPEGVELSDFNSVLIHCEKFSVLWGGGGIS